MRGEDYVHMRIFPTHLHSPHSRASKIYILRLLFRSISKNTSMFTTKLRNFTRFSLSNFNHISVLSNFTIPRSFGTSNPPHSAVLEAEGRAILGAFQARLRESIRSSNSNPHLLVPRPPQKAANSLAALCHTNASALREKP